MHHVHEHARNAAQPIGPDWIAWRNRSRAALPKRVSVETEDAEVGIGDREGGAGAAVARDAGSGGAAGGADVAAVAVVPACSAPAE